MEVGRKLLFFTKEKLLFPDAAWSGVIVVAGNEQDLAAEQLKEFFSVGNEVTIDGIVVNPVIDRPRTSEPSEPG